MGLIGVSVLDLPSGPADVLAGGTGETRVVQAVTSTGRLGAYYVPQGRESQALPLLVFFHGTGGKGWRLTRLCSRISPSYTGTWFRARWGRRPRTWLSAGDRDRVRTVEYMRSVAARLGQDGFPKVELRLFRADHTLQDEELGALVAWWLR
jgi:predicted esterase